jgi:membrane protease YdiL (CAAX protease family)
MPEPLALGVFLAAAVVVSVLWGLALWFFAERPHAFRGWVFFAMAFTRRPAGEVRAVLLSAIYYGIGLLAALAFAFAYGLAIRPLVSFTAADLGLVPLGVVGEISVTNLVIHLVCRMTGQGRPEQFAEIGEIPWMKGLRELPSWAVPWAAALGGVTEELLFRGVLLGILAERFLVAPWVAVAIAGALFSLAQLLQVRTAFQAFVLGSSCAAISLGGGLLVLLTRSAVPAVLCHAGFVVFFMARPEPARG